MKKQILIKSIPKLFILVLLTMFYISCKKDSSTETSSQDAKYSELQSWYNTEKAKSSAIDNALPGLMPNWEKVTARQDSSKIIYEVEVENPNKVFLANEKIDISNAAESYKLSQFRLVIIADQRSKEIKGGFMNILGDNSNEAEKEMHYKKAGTFSGKIQFYSISGKYLNGWVYKNGKIDKTIKPGQITLGSNVKTEYEQCSYTSTPRFGTVCAGDGCTTTFLGYDTTTSCQSFGGDGDGGGGGNFGSGGGSPGTNPPPSPPEKPKEIFIDPNVRPCIDTMRKNVVTNANIVSSFQNIFTYATNTNNVADMINRINNASDWNVTIKEGDIGTNLNARTTAGRGAVSITFNATYLNQASNLSIARTMIHEMMHVYFTYGLASTLDPGYNQFVEANNLLYNTEGQQLNNQNNAQHEQIANKYVEQLAIMLQSYAVSSGIESPDKNITLLDYCKDLAWGGLIGTEAYKLYAPNKEQIETHLFSEQSHDANSTKKKGC